jgi:hypothetical protein
MALHVLWLTDGPISFIKRSLATALGFAAVVGALLGLSRFGTHTLFHDMMEITKAQAAGANDFRSTLNSWLYFFYAERAALLLWVCGFLGALLLEFSRPRPAGRRILTPLRLMAMGFGALYLIFFVDSDLRHHLVVHGRHSRQLVPFLIVGFGIGCDQLCARFRHGALSATAVAAALVLNAALIFREPFAMVFPRDFDSNAEAVLKGLPPLIDGKSYYRKVNVDHFTYEPEVLPSPPVETLLASPHPLHYLPYIYEGESQALKRRRVAVDHRMRLVRMAVPEAEQVKGDPYGLVELTVVFPSDRAGFTEPLLSVGPRHNGDLFYIYYMTAEKAQLKFLNMGDTSLTSAPFSYKPGQARVLRLFSGSLMPPGGQTMAGVSAGEAALLRHRVYATIDGAVLLDKPATPHDALPGEAYAGVNAVEAGASGAQFWGSIRSAIRGGLPPLPQGIGKDQNFGAVHLEVAAPAVSNGTAEPLLVAGVPGRAVLGYMRIHADGSLVFGVEIWGVGNFEGKPMPRPPGASLDVNYSFGSLYPRIGDPAWGNLPEATQRAIAGRIRITVNGKVVLDLARDTPDLSSLPVTVGSNPVGGSLVNAGFSGRVLFSYRKPIGN